MRQLSGDSSYDYKISKYYLPPRMLENILKALMITPLTPKQTEHRGFVSMDPEQLKSRGMNPLNCAPFQDR